MMRKISMKKKIRIVSTATVILMNKKINNKDKGNKEEKDNNNKEGEKDNVDCKKEDKENVDLQKRRQ